MKKIIIWLVMLLLVGGLAYGMLNFMQKRLVEKTVDQTLHEKQWDTKVQDKKTRYMSSYGEHYVEVTFKDEKDITYRMQLVPYPTVKDVIFQKGYDPEVTSTGFKDSRNVDKTKARYTVE
ncbi:DUF3139 domain-containing protein [Macrococcus carouselicus]|nr:DUF3139 domain-containing protein [Macrococcus carouselicus]